MVIFFSRLSIIRGRGGNEKFPWLKRLDIFGRPRKVVMIVRVTF